MLDASQLAPRARALTGEISRISDAGVNTLGLILRKLDLPPESRSLDVGGAAYGGKESTCFLAELYRGQIDALRPKARDVDEFVQLFGERVQLLEALPAAQATPYDLVVLAPNSVRTFADLRHFTVTRSSLIRSGGYLICHGVRPDCIDSPDFLRPPEEVVEEFKFSFDFIDAHTAVLPSYLAGFRWFGFFPRKTKSRSYLAWYVLQKAEPAANGVANTEPAGGRPAPRLRDAAVTARPSVQVSAPARETPPPARPAAVNGVLPHGGSPNLNAPLKVVRDGFADVVTSAADSSKLPQQLQMAKLLTRVKRFGPEEYQPVLNEIQFLPLPAEIIELLATRSFDTVMFVNNAFEGDARVMKTAHAVGSFGRRLLAIGLSKGASYELRTLADGCPLVLVPNHISAISKGLKKLGFPLDVGPRYEIWMAVFAVYISWLLINIRDKPPCIVVHSHDFMGAFAGGNAVRLAGSNASMAGTTLKWVHDVHEFVQQYDIIDPTLQKIGCLWEEALYTHADAMSTVSGTLADHLVRYYRLRKKPSIIYNSNRLSARFKYRGPSCRDFVGCGEAPILVHSGSIRPGRGVDLAIEGLKHVEDAHLLLLTGSDTPYLATLLQRADELGVRNRIHLHPLLPYDEVAGFIAGANAGLIPMEHYGNADVALPNKLFDYISAEIPVISADTDNIKALMSDWRIGCLFPAKDVDAFVGAIRDVVANQDAYRAAMRSRPDMMLSFAWEAQVLKLFDIYRGLSAFAGAAYEISLPQY